MDLANFKHIVFNEILIHYPQCVLDEQNSDNDKVSLRLPMSTKDDAEAFKSKISSIMKMEWVVYYSQQQFDRVIFTKTWICHNSSKNKTKSSKTKRNAKCEAKLKIVIKKVTKSTIRTDKFLSHDPPLTGEVKLSLKHLHSTASAESLRMLRVNEEVKCEFFEYFSNGLGAGEAIRCHENKFLYEEDNVSLANASINPTRRQVNHLIEIWRESNLGSFINPLEKLKSKLDLYESNGTIVRINDTDPWSVVIVTPVMQRLHSLESSKEMTFVDSTCSCESTSTSITILLASTKVGALPLAVLIHPAQTAESYVNAFKLLEDSFPSCFGEQTHPQIFMTDDSSAEKNALKSVWPESVQLLCHFHVAQAEWRWLFSHTEEVKKDERPRLMKLFQDVMYANSPEALEKAVRELCKEEEHHPKFVQRFLKFYDRKHEWVLLYRQELMTRQNNTNNYAEATIRVLKDIVLCRTKAFNVVALAEFCITMWEPYLVKKLLEYAYSRKNEVNIIYDRFLKKTETFVPEQIKEIDKNIFLYSSKVKKVCYTINSEIGSCSCPSGISGAFCKHQFFLMKEKNISFSKSPPISQSDKYELAVLAVGSTKSPPLNFFESFHTCSSINSFDNSDVTMNYSVPSKNDNSDIASDVAPIIASKEQKDSIKKELYRLSNLLDGDGDFSQNAANKVLRTLKDVKDISDLSKLYFFKSKSTGKIKVQPTSISRSRPGVVRSGARIPSGRPPTLMPNKGTKRKRNLKESASENRPNAKSHGSNH